MAKFSEREIKNIIKMLGDAQEAKDFAYRINHLIGADLNILEFTPQLGKTHKEILDSLNEILNHTDELLRVLKRIRFELGADISAKPNRPLIDPTVAMLIRGSFLELGASNLLNGLSTELTNEERGKAHLTYVHSVPFNYPAPVMDMLKEMQEAVVHAIKSAGKGTKESGSRKSIRKNWFAKNFVFQYRATFGYFPPETKGSKLHQVFDMCLYALDLSTEESNFSLLRKAIKQDKKLFDNAPETKARLAAPRPQKYNTQA
jgi:hypothetical protein